MNKFKQHAGPRPALTSSDVQQLTKRAEWIMDNVILKPVDLFTPINELPEPSPAVPHSCRAEWKDVCYKVF